MARKLNLDTSERLDITCKRGDSFSLELTLKDTAGQALPLESDDYKFQMQVRLPRTSVTAAPSSAPKGLPEKTSLVIGTSEASPIAIEKSQDSKSFSIPVKNDNGQVQIYATASTMATIAPGRYIYEIQYSLNPGDTEEVKTILKGSFVVVDDVAN
jgi:hypothetical protein